MNWTDLAILIMADESTTWRFLHTKNAMEYYGCAVALVMTVSVGAMLSEKMNSAMILWFLIRVTPPDVLAALIIHMEFILGRIITHSV